MLNMDFYGTLKIKFTKLLNAHNIMLNSFKSSKIIIYYVSLLFVWLLTFVPFQNKFEIR